MSDEALQAGGPKRRPFIKDIFGKNEFDDRIDVRPEIGTGEAVILLGRCIRLITRAKWLFAFKFVLQL